MKTICLTNRGALMALFLILVFACKNDDDVEPVATIVVISNKDYPTIKINNQLWIATNFEGEGGIRYNASGEKPEYGKYYTFEESKAVSLPEGWRIPTIADYIKLAESQGITVTNLRATNQDQIKKLASLNNWRTIPGNNLSGFNAYPAGYSFNNSQPMDGDIAEFWTSTGETMSIQEGALGVNHNLMFYNNSGSPEYRFNLRFVKDI